MCAGRPAQGVGRADGDRHLPGLDVRAPGLWPRPSGYQLHAAPCDCGRRHRHGHHRSLLRRSREPSEARLPVARGRRLHPDLRLQEALRRAVLGPRLQELARLRLHLRPHLLVRPHQGPRPPGPGPGLCGAPDAREPRPGGRRPERAEPREVQPRAGGREGCSGCRRPGEGAGGRGALHASGASPCRLWLLWPWFRVAGTPRVGAQPDGQAQGHRQQPDADPRGRGAPARLRGADQAAGRPGHVLLRTGQRGRVDGKRRRHDHRRLRGAARGQDVRHRLLQPRGRQSRLRLADRHVRGGPRRHGGHRRRRPHCGALRLQRGLRGPGPEGPGQDGRPLLGDLRRLRLGLPKAPGEAALVPHPEDIWPDAADHRQRRKI
mmetsp:Transcript_20941/g.62442  ORF Transcript_20941/g.62442 Transcript_20941/m.62442 type:complete len:377 (+) Transcript_20941:1087-2217(+)